MVILGNAETILIKFLKIYIYFLIPHIDTYVLQVITIIYKFYMWLGATPSCKSIYIWDSNFHIFSQIWQF